MRSSDWSSDVCASDLGLSEGLTNNRLRDLVAQALARAPELPEWIEPSLLARKGWPGWREALQRIHADPADALARERLAYGEIFGGPLALMLVRHASRRRRGVPVAGAGRVARHRMGRGQGLSVRVDVRARGRL